MIRLPSFFVLHFLLLFLPFCALHAQDYLFDIEHFTTEDGLSHNQVLDIFEDSRGIIWVGTTNGLNRYDGETFKHFTKKEHGLFKNGVGEIYEDKDGRLWLRPLSTDFYSGDHSTTMFNPFKEKSENLDNYLGKDFPINLKEISFIKQGKEKELLIFTQEGNFIVYRGLSHPSKNEPAQILEFPAKPHTPFVWTAERDAFWIQNYGYWSHLEQRMIQQPDTSTMAKINLEGIFLNQIFINDIENSLIEGVLPLYISSYPDNIFQVAPIGPSHGSASYYYYHLNEKGFHKYRFWQNGQLLDLSKTGVITLLDKKDGLMVVYERFPKNPTTAKSQLYLIKPKGTNDFEVLGKKEIPIKGQINKVKKIQNSIWFAFSGKGMHRLKLLNKKFEAFNPGFQQRHIVKDRKNRIWINSRERISTDHYFSLGYPFPGHELLNDQNGCIWGIAPKWRTLIKYCPPDYSPQVLPNGIFDYPDREPALFQDRRKQIWLFPNALMLDLESSTLHPYRAQTSLDSLNYYMFYHIWQDSQYQFWMATGGALYNLDDSLNLLGTYNANGTGKYQLPTNEVHHFHVDSAGIWWLGSAGDGLIRWDRKQEQFRQITKEDGLPSDIIHAVYEDDYGFLWLNTENGIVRFNKENFTSTRYGMEDGISHLEGNSRSHFRDEDGTLYFGSYVGITKFHPKDFVNEKASFRPESIEIFTMYQKEVRTGETINLLPNYLKRGQLELTNRQAFLEITFVPLDIDVMKNSQFEYQLEDEGERWIPIDKNRMSLADVPFGTFNLKVRNTDFNENSTSILEIPIFNPAPFYLQWWFIVLSLFGVVLTALAYGRLRTRNLKRQRAQLQAAVARQTKELQQQAEKLRNMDKVKSRFFANVSHELRTPITLIKGPIQSLLKNENLSNRGFTLLKKAQLSTDRLLKMVNEILDLTKLESGKLELEEKSIVLFPLLQRIISAFESHAQNNGIELSLKNEANPSLQIQLDKNKFETILHNFLSNALKFTPKNGQVAVVLKDLGTTLQLAVEDTGRGIHPDDLPHIFNRFYQTKRPDAAAEGGTGIGLALCAELAKLFKGKIGVTSVLGKGSSFYFEFPKKEIFKALSDEEAKAIYQKENKSKNIEASKSTIVNRNSTIVNRNSSIVNQDRPTILLVEDNYHLRDYIQFVLSEKYNVMTAENGEDALKVLSPSVRSPQSSQTEHIIIDKIEEAETTLESHHQMGEQTEDLRTPRMGGLKTADLIISDVMMPIMDGFQLLEKLKSDDRYRHIPVVMLTARAEIKDKLKALRIGVDDYLVKPFEEEELLVRIENLLKYGQNRNLNALPIKEDSAGNTPKAPVMSEEDMQWLETLESTVLEKMENVNFTVEHLAQALAMSKSSLERRLKRLLDMTVSNYIKEIRFNQARSLLEMGKHTSVKSVAYKVGFKDVKNFSRLFKKRFGKLPSAYFLGV